MEEMSLKELKEVAKQKGIEVAKNATREQVVAALNGVPADPAAPPVEPKAPAKKAPKEKFFLGNCVKTGEPLYKEI